MTARLTSLALCCLAAGCIDTGYEVPRFDAGMNRPRDVGDCRPGPADPTRDGPQIHFIQTLSVDETRLIIQLGDVVTWTNNDSTSHTATAGSPSRRLQPFEGGFDSGNLSPGSQWAYRFCTPGGLEWFCATHPGTMFGYRLQVR